MTTSNSEKRILDLMERARNAYLNHQIVKEETGRWLVKSPNGSAFWFEVVVLAGGRLLFHGDTEPCLWARYHPAEKLSPELQAIATVRWMASRSRPDDSYFLEKAKIGTETDSLVFRDDEEVLREEISELIREEEEAGNASTVEELREILEKVDSGSESQVSEIQREIYDLLGDGERVPRGRSVSSGIVYAHAGLQRLLFLLDERAKVTDPIQA